VLTGKMKIESKIAFLDMRTTSSCAMLLPSEGLSEPQTTALLIGRDGQGQLFHGLTHRP
jgi:hypothetical protein